MEARRRATALGTLLAVVAGLVAGCSRDASNPMPPRAGKGSIPAPQASYLAVPIAARLADLEAQVNARVPTTIFALDRREAACVPAQRIGKVKVTPAIPCRLVGHVERGPIRITGAGDRLRIAMPVSAGIEAKELLGFIGTNEATGKAVVTADVRLALDDQWNPVPKADIRYRWTEEPGVKLARHRIRLTREADKALGPILAGLEASLPAEVAKLHPRALIERGWMRAHTSIMLNRTNPEVWMRLTPRALGFGGYRVDNGELKLFITFDAGAETFVGHRPPDPPVVPLPPPAPAAPATGFRLVIPVLADWAILEGQLEKALAKVAARGIEVPGLGRARVAFGRPDLFAANGGRVAVGLPMQVEGERGILSAKGKVWLTGAVSNVPDSQQLRVADLKITGDIPGAQGRILLAVAQAPAVRAAVEQELSANFSRDYAKLLEKIDRALTDKRLGGFVLNARIEKTRNGVIRPLGEGAFLLVEAEGDARLSWQPAAAGG